MHSQKQKTRRLPEISTKKRKYLSLNSPARPSKFFGSTISASPPPQNRLCCQLSPCFSRYRGDKDGIVEPVSLSYILTKMSAEKTKVSLPHKGRSSALHTVNRSDQLCLTQEGRQIHPALERYISLLSPEPSGPHEWKRLPRNSHHERN